MTNSGLVQSPPVMPRSARRLAWAVVLTVLLSAAAGVMAISLLSAARAYVGGESQWSRAQKVAVLALLRYIDTGQPADWQAWQAAIGVTLGDRAAREALDQPQPDLDAARAGFLAGHNHPDDVPGMIRLYRCCSRLPFMSASVAVWREADGLVESLRQQADEVQALYRREGGIPPAAQQAFKQRVLALDARMTPLEARFSAELGAASRLADHLLLTLLLTTALLLAGAGVAVVRHRALQDQVATQAIRRSETLFRSLWETTNDTVLIVDVHDRIRFANPAAEQLFGHAVDRLVGQPLSLVQPARLREGHAHGMARYMATGQRRLNWSGTAVPALRSDGSEVPVEVRFARFELEGETLFVGFLRDITERQRAEQAILAANSQLEQRVQARTLELTRANDRLKELDRLKSEFLATMSHELRTPLNSILGFATLLHQGMTGPLTDEQRRQLGFIKGSGEHLLSLINDLLDLSRIESGRMDVARAPFDLRTLADEVLTQLQPLAARKGLQLGLDLPAAMPMVGDQRKTFQVLLNLVGNAVKFTETGSVLVRGARDGDDWRLDVQDTGIGIAAEHLPLLFQAFRQIDTGSARSHEGTGLGLHLTQRLLLLMGGRIAVRSQPGVGSCFSMHLPVTGPAAPADAVPAPATDFGVLR